MCKGPEVRNSLASFGNRKEAEGTDFILGSALVPFRVRGFLTCITQIASLSFLKLFGLCSSFASIVITVSPSWAPVLAYSSERC